MRVDDFDFDLPTGLIAQRPAVPRDSARLLSVSHMGDHTAADLPGLLQPGDILVFNDSRVIPARLAGTKEGTETKIQVTLHKRIANDTWAVFAKPAKKLQVDDRVYFARGFTATALAKGLGGEVTLKFSVAGPDLLAALEMHGAMPLPPYIKRDTLADARDKSDYQTLFAACDGAVAAPTAGLHFTPDLLKALDAHGVKHTKVTLHVGAGTFLPVKADDTDDHVMHAEWGEITDDAADAINATHDLGHRVVAVGTTSLRLLESAADEGGRVRPFAAETAIFITPGYRFKIVDLLLTNFHLPRSTLFMLVAAFAGLEKMKKAYQTAIARGYRFYSYGDACLLEKDDGS